MLLECYLLIAWVTMLLVALVAFAVDAVIHGY